MQNLLARPAKIMSEKKPPFNEIPIKVGTKTRTIQVDYLARVEGEGALYIEMENEKIKDVKLKIFEPPRFFEAFMRSRHYLEAPDITSRICGICPIAYQMSAVCAMENALGITLSEEHHALRRLLYCGEWIESHCLHIFMLHIPDFLGYDDAITMSKKYPQIIQDGLFLKKQGNEIVKTLGGREVHPINIRVGGFYKIPDKSNFIKLKEKLLPARDKALATLKWINTLDFPAFDQDYEFIALSHPDEYPMMRGEMVSSKGLHCAVSAFEDHIEEFQVPHSNAYHARLKTSGHYFVGPMARYNLNHDKLSPFAREARDNIGFESYCTNPFRSILIRMLEVLYAFDEAIRIIDETTLPKTPFVDTKTKESIGFGLTEAPRGILYHRYKIDKEGSILDAKIIPPTSQNQATIEKDIAQFVIAHQYLSPEKLTWQCEQAIRNYDPCISCSTHFLKLHYYEPK